FPGGSEQQQITTYSHKDTNNEWVIERGWGAPARSDDDPIEFVLDGDTVRLVHDQTKKNLHSHNIPAPITDSENEVSGYGDAAANVTGDPNDNWIIRRVDDFEVGKGDRFRSLTTRFQLYHVVTGCLLKTTSVTLPEWGFKQGEVVCEKKPDKTSTSGMWNIELHINPRLPAGGKGDYKISFLRNFVDLNIQMWTSNNALTPDPDKEPGQLESQPYHWPFMLRGLRMCGWGDHEIKYYLIGNPLIWWGTTAAMVVLAGSVLIYTIRAARGSVDFLPRKLTRRSAADEWSNFVFASKVGLLGWFLHYIPFYIMGRVMYVHHYFPALYFAMIAFVTLSNHVGSRLSKPMSILLPVALALVFTAAFLFFADFAFGMDRMFIQATNMLGPAREWASRQWLPSWNLYD
ncbi:Protein O-mannosyltransferase 2, partial [Kappamyces sp. JEL0680]